MKDAIYKGSHYSLSFTAKDNVLSDLRWALVLVYDTDGHIEQFESDMSVGSIK